jgi:hypothetical protein
MKSIKSIKPIVLALSAVALLSFTISKSNLILEEYEDVGIIKQSILKPSQFNKTQEGTWVILKGQELSRDSELFKLLEENSDLNILDKKDDAYFLPDARGMFIRSSNINGEGLDPDDQRLVGSFQEDALQQHTHKVAKGRTDKSAGSQTSPSKQRFADFQSTYAGPFSTGGHNGRPSTETRPVNISMYTYMKVSI